VFIIRPFPDDAGDAVGVKIFFGYALVISGHAYLKAVDAGVFIVCHCADGECPVVGCLPVKGIVFGHGNLTRCVQREMKGAGGRICPDNARYPVAEKCAAGICNTCLMDPEIRGAAGKHVIAAETIGYGAGGVNFAGELDNHQTGPNIAFTGIIRVCAHYCLLVVGKESLISVHISSGQCDHSGGI